VELERAAEILGGPIVVALLGKGAVPDDSVYTTGPIGLCSGRGPRRRRWKPVTRS
jgi:pyruvate dehydrogenase (quinone)/pyruvate oxidase